LFKETFNKTATMISRTGARKAYTCHQP